MSEPASQTPPPENADQGLPYQMDVYFDSYPALDLEALARFVDACEPGAFEACEAHEVGDPNQSENAEGLRVGAFMVSQGSMTIAAIACTRAGSVTRSTEWVTPSTVTEPTGSPGSRNRSVSPLASDNPQIGERLARVARVRSSRSVDAFGVVRSWGSTRPAPSSTTSSAPTTPTMSRALPAASVKRWRYSVNDGSASRRKRRDSAVARRFQWGWACDGSSCF